MFSLKLALSLSLFTLIKRLFSSSLLSAIRGISSAYQRLLMFLPLILIPVCNSPSLAFLLMCSVYRLNKQGDSRQACHTPFSFLNQSLVPYRVLAVTSGPAYRFLRRQIRRSGIYISLSSVQFSPVTQSCLTICDPMNRSTPGHPVHHQLPEFTQTHVHRVGDAIQPSHPLSSPSPQALSLSQHQGLFK